MDAVDGCGVVFPVSVWMQKLKWEDQPRCITIMEPVERRTASVVLDSEVRSIHFIISFCLLLMNDLICS